MATEPLCIRFFWGPRRESRRACGDRLLAFLKGLRTIDPVFDAKWFRAGDNPFDPKKKPVATNKTALDALLKKGVNCTDYVPGSPPRPIRDLGFSVWLVSDGYHSVSLQVHCGVYSRWVRNSIILQTPNSGVAGKRLFRARALTELFELVVECWAPDVGQVWSVQLSEAVGESREDIQVGWLTYLADHYKSLPALDARFAIHPIGDAGRLIVATKQRLNIDNEHHVARLRDLAKMLNS